MRTLLLASLAALAVAACDSAEPPSPVTVTEPVRPATPPVAAEAPPAPAPQPSADELLEKRVQRALQDAREVPGQGVDATVAGGVVTLYGTVPSASDRRRIVEFVAGLGGVASVVNRLVVIQGS